MTIDEAIMAATSEMLPMFGLAPQFKEVSEEAQLSSASQVNVLIGFTLALQGNILIGLDKDTALKIAGAMMGGAQLTELDAMVKSALSELGNMLSGMIFNKVIAEGVVDISPPTLATGNNMFIMISRVKTRKFLFDLDGNHRLTVACSVE